ncbi:hypothetical protein BDQ17DRAFT_1426609 [Cyathus striatus]|nr:hypothetical protein BDQ17DRAFT_1426609 [Cyathus striatus]
MFSASSSTSSSIADYKAETLQSLIPECYEVYTYWTTGKHTSSPVRVDADVLRGREEIEKVQVRALNFSLLPLAFLSLCHSIIVAFTLPFCLLLPSPLPRLLGVFLPYPPSSLLSFTPLSSADISSRATCPPSPSSLSPFSYSLYTVSTNANLL